MGISNIPENAEIRCVSESSALYAAERYGVFSVEWIRLTHTTRAETGPNDLSVKTKLICRFPATAFGIPLYFYENSVSPNDFKVISCFSKYAVSLLSFRGNLQNIGTHSNKRKGLL